MENKYTVGLVVNGIITYLSDLNAKNGKISMSQDTSDMQIGSEDECLKLTEQLRNLTGQPFEVVEVEFEGE